MNIFYLHPSPSVCATYHCDKHICKMIIEYAQLLSTAHRVLDGSPYYDLSKKGRRVKRFKLSEPLNSSLYLACHINHPSSIWVRKSQSHYKWLYSLFVCCCTEYTNRYKKVHKTEGLKEHLLQLPKNISDSCWEDPPKAMPDEYKEDDTIQSYHNYYIGDKVSFAKWTHPSTIPKWFISNP